MNKKEYIKPETEELLIEPAQMIAASMPIGDGDADGSDGLSKDRQDEIEWGNLWN
jgi:hypothetical protein